MTDFTLYESADFFMARTALLPFNVTRADTPNRLLEFYYQHPLFQEALAIASPSLHQALRKGSFIELNKIYLSLLKYFLRMCSRTTPFGLFSCVGWGEFAEKTQLQFDLASLKKRVKPDMTWVKSLVNFFHAEAGLVQHLQVRANPNLMRKAKKFLLIKKSEAKATRDLISIRHTLASEAVLDLARKPILYADLEEKLSAQFSQHDRKKITACVEQMFQKEYLLSELSICVDRSFTLATLLDKIKCLYSQLPALDSLEQVNQSLITYEMCLAGQGISHLEHVLQQMNAWKKVDYPLHVDAFLTTTHIKLTHKIQEDLSHTATALWLLAQQSTQTAKLHHYHQAFLEKYGVYRLVPVMELINDTKGLGLPVEEIVETKPEQLSHLTEKLLTCVSGSEIIIDDLIQNLWFSHQEKFAAAPLSLELYFEILSSSAQEIEEGNYTLLMNPTMASMQAGNTFGRFFYGWEEKEAKIAAMRQFLEREEALNEQAVFVEASFLPEDPRVANVCYFEKIRQFQLHMHYQEPSPSLMDLNDLYVGATTQRLYLYSKRLQKEVCVSMSSAVNPDFAPPLLKFLLDISLFRFTPFSPYIWQGLAKTTVYLPRIKYRNTILCPARWYFNRDQLKRNLEAKNIEEALWKALHAHRVPETVYLTDFDRRLFIRWNHPEHFKLLCQQLIRQGEIILFEHLIGLGMQSQEGKHAAEFVVPMVKKKPYALPQEAENYPTTDMYAMQERLSIFEKKWIYAKLGLPKEEEEEFLKHKLTPFVQALMQTACIHKWFYIRYQEEKTHIRLRLHCASDDVYHQVMGKLSDWCAYLLSQESIRSISFHVYERELERYGGMACIEHAEEVFCTDSQMCCTLLEIAALPSNTWPLFAFAALGIIHFLKQVDGQLSSMIQYLAPMEKEKALLSGFRPHLKKVVQGAQILFFQENKGQEEDLSLAHLKQAFTLSSGALQRYREKMEELAQENTLQNTKEQLLDSLLHMHCNRLLGTDAQLEKKARVLAYHILKKMPYQISEQEKRHDYSYPERD